MPTAQVPPPSIAPEQSQHQGELGIGHAMISTETRARSIVTERRAFHTRPHDTCRRLDAFQGFSRLAPPQDRLTSRRRLTRRTRMKIWLPYIRGGSGVDVFTNLLAHGLRAQGVEAVTQALPHALQYAPHLLRALRPPQGTEVIVTNSWNGFAFPRAGVKLVVIEHHCIFDPIYTPYRSKAQGIFHDLLVRRFEQASFDHADLVIAVSRYTAQATAKVFSNVNPLVILNGVDTDFFSPGDKRGKAPDQVFRMLFVGNLTERKGADLLAPIMRELGPGFKLHYTGGLRTKRATPPAPNMFATGHLSNEALRQAYRDADALLFPTRLEGFGYAAAEAMSCGTPVIASDVSAIPEVVDHGVTGLLCPVNDVPAFIQAAKRLKQDPAQLAAMGTNAREAATDRFNLDVMARIYTDVFSNLRQQLADKSTPRQSL